MTAAPFFRHISAKRYHDGAAKGREPDLKCPAGCVPLLAAVVDMLAFMCLHAGRANEQTHMYFIQTFTFVLNGTNMNGMNMQVNGHVKKEEPWQPGSLQLVRDSCLVRDNTPTRKIQAALFERSRRRGASA